MGLIVVLIAGGLLAGCTEVAAPAPEVGNASVASAEPTAEPAQSAPEPRTVADLFPEAPGKALVIDNCGACHALACSVIGQRTAARWNSLREDHRDKAASLAEEDLQTIFTYLSEHFNDAVPEPRVPPHFLEQGCTPF